MTAGTGTAWLPGWGWGPRLKQVMKLTTLQRGKAKISKKKISRTFECVLNAGKSLGPKRGILLAPVMIDSGIIQSD